MKLIKIKHSEKCNSDCLKLAYKLTHQKNGQENREKILGNWGLYKSSRNTRITGFRVFHVQ